MELRDKVVLITGGATGIGRATALRFADAGAHVAINYSRSADEARDTADAVAERGVQAESFQADVADDAAVRAMVAEVVARFGRIDVLVNNAGITAYVAHDDFEGLTEEIWDRILAVNLKGIFFCCRAAADELRRNGGAIINITSLGGITGGGSSIAYAASKAAAISLTKSLARVFAPQVRVNALAPGIVMTRWVAGREEHVRRYSEGTPMGRPATAEDVAAMAHALASGGDFVTGQIIVVDGGMSLG
jgi:3-oxoacyl-[acyl-carrier protein] reductase